MFEIIPAIDILDGQCVRLKQGRYDDKIVYGTDPLTIAAKWASQGAKRLHVVDLDGARTGLPKNVEIIKKIVKELALPVQAGGGIRNQDLIQQLLEAGLDRVILGTTAVKNPNLLEQICRRFGRRIAVSIDAKEGWVAADGWTRVTKKDVISLAKEAVKLGVERFVYTDISRDGMMSGPNLDGIRNFVAQSSVPVIAAGGVTSPADIEKLKELGVEGCIVGKALYEGKIKLGEII